MAEIINLRQARKRRARAEAAIAADANRLQHGRTRAERETQAAERAKQERTLDGARRERDDD